MSGYPSCSSMLYLQRQWSFKVGFMGPTATERIDTPRRGDVLSDLTLMIGIPRKGNVLSVPILMIPSNRGDVLIHLTLMILPR